MNPKEPLLLHPTVPTFVLSSRKAKLLIASALFPSSPPLPLKLVTGTNSIYLKLHTSPPKSPSFLTAPMADTSTKKGDAFPHVPCIFFFPFPSPGHIIPMVDIAKLFAKRGADVTVVLTPLNAARFGSTVDQATASGYSIRLHVLPFPAAAGLPDGCESTDALPSRTLSGLFAISLDLLRDPFDHLVRECPPDAVVSDVFLPWTADTADRGEGRVVDGRRRRMLRGGRADPAAGGGGGRVVVPRRRARDG